MSTAGVYRITCTDNGKQYIGSTKDLARRWNAHKADLQYGRHHSPELQRDYNGYGPQAFVFEVVKECSYSEAKALEERLIEEEKPLYNAYCNGNDIIKRIEGHERNFDSKLLEIISPIRSQAFEEGKSILLVSIDDCVEITKIPMQRILNLVGAFHNGFNTFRRCKAEAGMIVGTLTDDEGVFVAIAKEEYCESGLSYSRLR